MEELPHLGRPIRVVGRYALYGKLAAGGMATVHFGRLLGPAGFSRTVAIKRLHPQFAKDPEFVAMFLDEARLAARIQHPNVVATVDVVAMSEELFLVMDYIRGESFSRLLRTSRKKRVDVPLGIVASVVTGMLHGLHAAHEAKDEQGRPLSVVHRDVSPQNVLVGADGVARVLDFGVAKAAARIQVTRDGQMKGKLCYMAPEQLKGLGVDRRTDVFAAGIVLWEALTGRRLFDAEEPQEVLRMITTEEIPPPSAVVPSIPRGVDAVVMKALTRELDKRYQTAREFAIALEDVTHIASGREVGEWVERVAGDTLQHREQAVAEIEAVSSVSDVSSPSGLLPPGYRNTLVGQPPPPVQASAPAAASEWEEGPTRIFDSSADVAAGLDKATRVQVPNPRASSPELGRAAPPVPKAARVPDRRPKPPPAEPRMFPPADEPRMFPPPDEPRMFPPPDEPRASAPPKLPPRASTRPPLPPRASVKPQAPARVPSSPAAPPRASSPPARLPTPPPSGHGRMDVAVLRASAVPPVPAAAGAPASSRRPAASASPSRVSNPPPLPPASRASHAPPLPPLSRTSNPPPLPPSAQFDDENETTIARDASSFDDPSEKTIARDGGGFDDENEKTIVKDGADAVAAIAAGLSGRVKPDALAPAWDDDGEKTTLHEKEGADELVSAAQQLTDPSIRRRDLPAPRPAAGAPAAPSPTIVLTEHTSPAMLRQRPGPMKIASTWLFASPQARARRLGLVAGIAGLLIGVALFAARGGRPDAPPPVAEEKIEKKAPVAAAAPPTPRHEEPRGVDPSELPPAEPEEPHEAHASHASSGSTPKTHAADALRPSPAPAQPLAKAVAAAPEKPVAAAPAEPAPAPAPVAVALPQDDVDDSPYAKPSAAAPKPVAKADPPPEKPAAAAPVAAKAPAKPAGPCAEPFTIDDKGIKRIKPECL
ncbi:MAG TPA: protein kinase [Polyangiaceae bacterium]|nr:protein kinase [Polyangiaceae bacterium]